MSTPGPAGRLHGLSYRGKCATPSKNNPGREKRRKMQPELEKETKCTRSTPGREGETGPKIQSRSGHIHVREDQKYPGREEGCRRYSARLTRSGDRSRRHSPVHEVKRLLNMRHVKTKTRPKTLTLPCVHPTPPRLPTSDAKSRSSVTLSAPVQGVRMYQVAHRHYRGLFVSLQNRRIARLHSERKGSMWHSERTGSMCLK